MVQTFADGRTRDLTSEATWRSSSSAVLSVDGTGRATGGEQGAAQIIAAFERYQGIKTVLVLRPGTYRVTGIVTEAGSGVFGIGDARVQVLSSGGVVAEATTRSNGRFELFGVEPHGELAVSRDGYLSHRRPLQISEDTTIDVELALAAPRADISGTYTLTVGSEACDGTSRLPVEWRQRTYTAKVVQSGPTVSVSLGGSEFAPRDRALANRFGGIVGPDGVTFHLRDETYYYYGSNPEVVELLPNGTRLAIIGTAKTTITPTTLSGTLEGVITNYSTASLPTILGDCRSSAHPFVLQR